MNETATEGTKRQREIIHRVTFTCAYCGKSDEGTRRKRFCSDTCRSQHFRHIRHATRQTIEGAQFRALAAIITLGEGAKVGSHTAIKALREIDKLLTNIADEIGKINYEEN